MCQGKFGLFMKNLKPNLNIQTDSIRAKITERMTPRMKDEEGSKKKNNTLSNLFRDSSKIELYSICCLPF